MPAATLAVALILQLAGWECRGDPSATADGTDCLPCGSRSPLRRQNAHNTWILRENPSS